MALIQKVAEGLAILNEVDSPYTRDMKEVFLNTYDIGAAMAERNRLEAAEQKRKEYEAEMARRKAEQEARRKAVTQAVAAAGRKMEEKELAPAPKEPVETVQDPVYAVDFRVHATEKQLDDLKHFLRSNGIRFEPVPKQ